MATNDFLPFATAGGANVLSQADWLALAARLSGYTSGVASSQQLNKTWRQSAAMAAMIGQFINNRGGVDAFDDGNITALLAAFETAYRKQATNFVATVGGTANALTATLDPAVSAWSDLLGVPLSILAAATNTASAPTISFNGLPPVVLTRRDGTPLDAGDIVSGVSYRIRYNGTVVRIEDVTFADFLISAPVTKTVGGASPDFANLQLAFEWLARFTITPTGSVTFSVRAGQHVRSTGLLVFSHPNGDKVSIVGAALTGAVPVPSDFASTGPGAPARASDATANLAMLRSRFSTELRFTSGSYFVVVGNINAINNILFSSDSAGSQNLVSFGPGQQFMTNCSVHGAANIGIYGYSCLLSALNVSVTGAAQDGIQVNHGGTIIYSGSLISIGNGGTGVFAQNPGSSVTTIAGVVSSFTNASSGVFAQQNAGIACPGATANNNGVHGFFAQSTATVNASASSATNHGGGYGFCAGQGSLVLGQNSACSGNVGNWTALSGSTIVMTGGTGSGASPAFNTIGNGNSIVIQ